MSNEIEQKVIEIIKEQEVEGYDLSNVSSENKLSEIGINSLSFIKIAVAVEKEFGVQFDGDNLDVNKFETIKSIIDFIENKMNA